MWLLIAYNMVVFSITLYRMKMLSYLAYQLDLWQDGSVEGGAYGFESQSCCESGPFTFTINRLYTSRIAPNMASLWTYWFYFLRLFCVFSFVFRTFQH